MELRKLEEIRNPITCHWISSLHSVLNIYALYKYIK